MCPLNQTKQVEVRSTGAIDSFVILITRDVPFFDPNIATISFFLVIVIITFSIFFYRLSEQKRMKNFGICEDFHENVDFRKDISISRSSKPNYEKLRHEECFEELYRAADMCYIKRYAEKCERLVIYCPYLINVKLKSTGQTPFHRICFHGEASLIAFMLANGANPNLKTDAGESPIGLAICNYTYGKNHEDLACLDVLQRAGCSFDKDDIWYNILLKMAVRGNKKLLTEWMMTNGCYTRPYGIRKIERQVSDPLMFY